MHPDVAQAIVVRVRVSERVAQHRDERQVLLVGLAVVDETGVGTAEDRQQFGAACHRVAPDLEGRRGHGVGRHSLRRAVRRVEQSAENGERG